MVHGPCPSNLKGVLTGVQARYIEATVEGIRIASIYLPNGNLVDSEKYPYKLKWMDRLCAHIKELPKSEQPSALGGDYLCYKILQEPQLHFFT